jgi:thiamine transporter
MRKKFTWWNNKPLWIATLFLAACLLSVIKIIVLPQGGSATFFSLLVLWLITFFFGFPTGAVFSVAFGFAKLLITYLTGEYIQWSFLAILLEYVLACGLFCVGGLLPEKEQRIESREIGLSRNIDYITEPFKMRMGYTLGVLLMFVCYVVSAMCCYDWVVPDFWGNLVYSIFYDGAYLLVEYLLTMILLWVPDVVNAIFFMKHVATTPEEDMSLRSF